jgi:hypothetical protein
MTIDRRFLELPSTFTADDAQPLQRKVCHFTRTARWQHEVVQRKVLGSAPREAAVASPPIDRTAGQQAWNELFDVCSGNLVQLDATGARALSDADTHAVAAAGVSGAGTTLPFAAQIKESFGSAHAAALDGISAHVGGAASTAASAIGASAYATGNAIAFAQAPDLHTAAHEAAHVIQQRHGVHLAGGIGSAGDSYEQHADAVADVVVRGESAAELLGGGVGASASGLAVQRKAQPVTADSLVDPKETADPARVTDPDAIVNMIASGIDLVYERASAHADALITALEEPAKAPEPSMVAAVMSAAVDVLLTVFSDGLYSILKGKVAAKTSEYLVQAIVGGAAKKSLDSVKKVAGKVVGSTDASSGASLDTTFQLRGAYREAVHSALYERRYNARGLLEERRQELTRHPVVELQRLATEVAAIGHDPAAMQQVQERAVLFGWMNLRSSAQLGHDATSPVQPDANRMDPTAEGAAVRGMNLAGSIEITVTLPDVVDGAKGITIADVEVNAEPSVKRFIKRCGLMLGELPVIRIVRIANKPVGRVMYLDAAGHIEIVPAAYEPLAAIGLQRPVDWQEIQAEDSDDFFEGRRGGPAGAIGRHKRANRFVDALQGAILIARLLSKYPPSFVKG